MRTFSYIFLLFFIFLSSQNSAQKKQLTHFFSSKDPKAQLIKEPVAWQVKFLYGTYGMQTLGKKLVSLFGKHATTREARLKFSTDKKLTKKQIDYYLKFYKNFIDMQEFIIPEQGFNCFNDWFIRSLKNQEKDRPLEKNIYAISSPADSKLLIIPNLAQDTEVTIKEQIFNLETFLQDKKLAEIYMHGTMMIFRLAPYDYHRYHYPIDCTVSQELRIPGIYQSVNRRAFYAGAKPLTVNKRSYELVTPTGSIAELSDKPIIMVQVGATAVASIVNHFTNQPEDTLFARGSETGYFQFGGSTIVLLFKKDTIIVNKQITKNSLAGYETAVKVRETIAHWKI
jgi:phosphatidylserine decarboxylase